MRKNLWIFILSLVSVMSLGLFPAYGASLPLDGNIIYVDQQATGANNGSSWENAFTDLQAALGQAISGDQIWVAAGSYFPSIETCGSGNPRYVSFQLKNGVAVYGGFDPSVGDNTWDERDWEANVAILSGDIGDPYDIYDNSYHVFCHPESLQLDSSAVLDGFTVDGGYGDQGGGMYNDHASPTLIHVIFSNNTANYGGGLYNSFSSPALTSVIFSKNSGGSGGGMANFFSSPTLASVTFWSNYGSGLYNESSSPMLTEVTFLNNGSHYGGGMYNVSGSSPTLFNVDFTGNSSMWGGGGMYNWKSSSPKLSNVSFSNNISYMGGGGGMYNWESSSPSFNNVIFSNNTARVGGGMYNDSSSPQLVRVTFSANIAADTSGGGMYNTASSTATLTNVLFSANKTEGDDGGGGGLANNSSSSTLTNVTFSDNTARLGGAILNWYSSAITLTNVTIVNNLASFGGGIHSYQSTATLTNVTFSGNTALGSGGGMESYYSPSTLLKNVTFTNNTAVYGSAINNQYSVLTLSNCILWGDVIDELNSGGYTTPTVTFSDVQGGYVGEGNIDANPLLDLLADNGGFIFTHALGLGSPAIDAGNPDPGTCPTTDGRLKLRPLDGDGDGTWRCDMGAYEFQLLPLPVLLLPLLVR